MRLPRLCYRRNAKNGLIIEKDVAPPPRDGANICIDLFRPDTDQPVASLIV